MSGKRKYVWHNNTFVDVTDWKPPPRKTPYIVRDSMEAAVHPATGQVLDSKSKFREITRAHGLIEVGNEKPTIPTTRTMSKAERKKDIATAIEQLEQGYTPPPVETAQDWAKDMGGETRVYE